MKKKRIKEINTKRVKASQCMSAWCRSKNSFVCDWWTVPLRLSVSAAIGPTQCCS